MGFGRKAKAFGARGAMIEAPDQPGVSSIRHAGPANPIAAEMQPAITLGIEEELQVVDARTGALVAHDIPLVKHVLPDGSGAFGCEIHKCAIELQTSIASHPDMAIRTLSALRNAARTQAALRGQKVLAAGLHPFSQWKHQAVHEDTAHYPHYAHLLHEFGDIARSAMSFGLHIHLGLPDPQYRMPVMNALRSVLPDVLALSVSSPFHEGRDTGLASWRHSLLGRYPRMGIPDVWPDEKTYFDSIAMLRRLGSLEPDQGMWDDLRLHHRYGTLEVRICDAVHSLQRIWLIVALLQCETAILMQEAANGGLPEPEPRLWIEENKWRARRYGTAATFIDWRRNETISVEARFERWLERILPAATKFNLWPQIELTAASVLREKNEADQQRTWYLQGGSFEAVVNGLADATAVSWTPPAPIRRNRRDISESSKAANQGRNPLPASSAFLRTGRPTS